MTSAGDKCIQVQNRDGQLLRGLFDSRLMTLTHAAALFFNGSREAAKKRVGKLKAAGLIGERERKAYEPSILFLTRQGFELLRDRGLLQHVNLSWTTLEKRLQVSPFTLQHELAVMDVKAAFCSALQKNPALRTEEFSTWPRLFEFLATPGSGGEVLVKPDGFIRIREEEGSEVFEQTFFLELDRSTETLDTLGRRALCYLDFYQRGGLAERFGRPRSEYKDFPFRVLMIFKTEERRNNMAERLLTQTPPILTQVWLSTLKEVTTSPLGQIWIRPRDYREATEGTAYAVGGRAFPSTYRRQLAREVLVEAAVKKHELFRKDS